MATVVKIVNVIVKQSGLTHRQFQCLLKEMDTMKAILAQKGQDYPEFEDKKWGCET